MSHQITSYQGNANSNSMSAALSYQANNGGTNYTPSTFYLNNVCPTSVVQLCGINPRMLTIIYLKQRQYPLDHNKRILRLNNINGTITVAE